MELRDYLRMLRRGWPVVLLITALFVGVAALYVTIAPKRFEATTTLHISTNGPSDVSDLQQGHQFALNSVSTYAEVVASATVLDPAAQELRPQATVDDLAQSVWAVVPTDTTLINLTASDADPVRATTVANVVATNAIRVVPALELDEEGQPLVKLQQIRPAIEPTRAVSPNVQRILALGLIIGVCVGLAATITAQSLDTRIRRAADVRRLTEVPVLAVLPQLTRRQRHGLVVRDDPAGPAGEAFRMLRTNLRFLEAKDRRSLVFTAMANAHDQAHVPVNLAWSLAQAGRRVLLVDLDLRCPTIGQAIGIRSGAGLADVLAGRVDLSDVIHETRQPRLHVVLGGSVRASPSDLLSAPILSRVLRRMEQEFDYVILHAPPLLSFTDAAVVAGAAGGTLVTAAVGKTRAHELTTALDTLANVWVKPLGLVLTRARRSDRPGGVAADVEPRNDEPPKVASHTLRHFPADRAQPSVPASPVKHGGRGRPASSARPSNPA
jgi:capsular exopolysaccharide synthesis family protein